MPITVPTRSTSRTFVGVAGLCVLALAATTAPVTTANPAAGAYPSARTVSLVCADETGGSGHGSQQSEEGPGKEPNQHEPQR